MTGVRRSHEDCIHLRRVAQSVGGIKGQRNVVLPGGLLGLGRSAPRKRNHAAIAGRLKAGHQPLDRMQSETDDSKVDHRVGSPDLSTSAQAKGLAAVLWQPCLI